MSDNQDRSIADQETEPSLFDAEISRRRALQIAGAGAAVAAAGMAAPATLAGATTPAAGKVREFHAAWPYTAPPVGHFNEYASNGYAILTSASPSAISIYVDLLELPMAKYRWASDTWMPLMATSWTLVKTATLVVHLRRGAHWSDGSAFTSQDVLTT